ncbi:MAG: amidohydrolase family protein [bacterium]|nr:amidohydrolase family protein [bacterium]
MYFDGGMWGGREPKYGLENADDKIQAKMDARFIDRALFAHFEAVYYDMYSGNARTLAEAQKYPDRLIPMAVINPWHYDTTANYLAELKISGFKAIGFFSHYQLWKLHQSVFHRIVKDLSQIDLPVVVGVASLEELALAVEVFKPLQTPVLIRWVRGGGYNAVADEIAIALDHPNFYFDVHNLVSVDAIKLLAEKIGSEHLFVSTNSPLVYEDSPLLLLESNQLSAADRENIAHGTLDKIFKITAPTAPGSIASKHAMGIARPKIDVHWHFHGWDIMEPGKELAAMRRMFNECGYEKVICSSVWALNFDLQAGNAATAELLEKDSRLCGYIVVDPIRVPESLLELEKYAGNPRFVGIKTIQDYYNIGIDDPRYEPFLRWADGKNLPVLCHRAGVINAAKKFPTVIFIAGHISHERLLDLPELAKLPNVMIDVSGSYAHRGETRLDEIIKTVGVDRVLYSSDGPLISTYWALGKLFNVELSAEDQEKIYYQNALRIFPNILKF